jgi:hypothetical protein
MFAVLRRMFTKPEQADFEPTELASGWDEHLPSGPVELDDGACTKCPDTRECAERRACQRRAGA